jgi:hypothetical protein
MRLLANKARISLTACTERTSPNQLFNIISAMKYLLVLVAVIQVWRLVSARPSFEESMRNALALKGISLEKVLPVQDGGSVGDIWSDCGKYASSYKTCNIRS